VNDVDYIKLAAVHPNLASQPRPEQDWLADADSGGDVRIERID
jgi:hypothetical protein